MKELLLLVLAQNGTLVAAVYLMKKLLDHQMAKELKTFESTFKRQDERAQIRFSKLHEDRAELLKELYSDLVQLEQLAGLSKYDPVIGSASDKRELQDKLGEVERKFALEKLLLSENICDRIQNFLSQLGMFDATSRIGAKIANIDIDRKERIYENLKRVHETTLKPLLKEIESEFRRLLEVSAE